jgi:hypothetical protein
MDQATKKPPVKYTWKPPAAEREAVASAIAESGLSANAFLTQLVLGKRRPSYPSSLIEAAGRLLATLAPIRDHLRRLDQSTDDDERNAILVQIRDLLIQIRSALFQILGRKP